ncbi:hypothetical protein IWW55_006385, partial [Coemansia sp. RSA 2706]
MSCMAHVVSRSMPVHRTISCSLYHAHTRTAMLPIECESTYTPGSRNSSVHRGKDSEFWQMSTWRSNEGNNRAKPGCLSFL